MRDIDVSEITLIVSDMCIDANLRLSEETVKCITAAKSSEDAPLAVEILGQLEENMKIAEEDRIPICQDTGMAVFFVELGQEVHITGGSLTDAINEGVRRGYTDGYLRKDM